MDSDLEIAREQVSQYAMALDLLARLSYSDTEKEAIANIIEIFTVLFSPQKVEYFPCTNEQNRPDTVSFQGEAVHRNPQSLFLEKESWTESATGFFVKISHQKKALGIIEVEAIAFPEHKEQYLNLALSLVDVCGLVIENARQREQLKRNEHKLRQEKERAEQALEEVRQLSGLLPICMHCKNIRDDQGYWNKIETYIQKHSEAEFSHGICEKCLDKYYPEYTDNEISDK